MEIMNIKRENGQNNRFRSVAMAAGLGLAALVGGYTNADASPEISRNTLVSTIKSHLGDIDYKEAIKEINTPEQDILYRDYFLKYNDSVSLYGIEKCVKYQDGRYGYDASFKQTHEKGQGNCFGIAVAMAAMLTDNEYPPLILYLKKPFSDLERNFAREAGNRFMENAPNELSHAIYIYQKDGKWGCIGAGSLEDREPKYNKLKDMVKSLKVATQPKGYEIDEDKGDHGVVNLDKRYGRENWIDGNVNLTNFPMPNAHSTYNSTAYCFMAEKIRAQGYKAASKNQLVREAVEEKICSEEVARSHFDMARNSVQREAELFASTVNQTQGYNTPTANSK